MLQKAETLGATILNYAEALYFEKDNTGKLKSLHIKDTINEKTFDIHAKVFINATGPFADHIRQLANPNLKARMKVSRGAHIVLPPNLMKNETAILVPKTDDGRVLFIIPWQDHLLVGTPMKRINFQKHPTWSNTKFHTYSNT
jgi:glycerol-3-phosphate dehydrogenase